MTTIESGMDKVAMAVGEQLTAWNHEMEVGDYFILWFNDCTVLVLMGEGRRVQVNIQGGAEIVSINDSVGLFGEDCEEPAFTTEEGGPK